MEKVKSTCFLAVAVFALSAAGATAQMQTLARQSGAFGIVTYDPELVRTPEISPESGRIFQGSLTVSMSCETAGAAIYYTTDGSEPTKDSTAYRKFKISGKTTIKAIAYDAARDMYSDVATAEYALGRCENPVIAPSGGSAVASEDGYVFYHDGQLVTIAQSGGEGTIRYTLDGSEPAPDSAIYTGPIAIDATATIKTKVFSGDYFDSETVAVVFTREWEQVSTPEISAPASFAGSRTKCEISCATDGATIFYTLDGSAPTSHSMRYKGAFYVSRSCTIKAFAVKSGCLNSEVVELAVAKEWVIGDSMGAPDHQFATAGDGGNAFYSVEDGTAPGGVAMHSGDIGDSDAYGAFAKTTLSTTVRGPGTASFSWKASCEDDAPDYEWDHGEFAVDGVVKAYISGETEWASVSVEISGSGEHTLTWTYLKDDAESAGDDCLLVAGWNWASAEQWTHTTLYPVPYAWLRGRDEGIPDEYDAYEAAANVVAANGRRVWECYLLGLDPADPEDDWRITRFWMEGDVPKFEFNRTTDGGGNSFLPFVRVLGKAKLSDIWQVVPEGGDPSFRFFTVEVVPPGGESIVDRQRQLGGVQLWKDGPYWAECNVGATKPEEYGYYFWWGDTVGYKLNGNGWVSSKDGTSFTFLSSSAAGSTLGKANSALQSEGYIDSTGNLDAAHDAATAHLGAQWRMPTSAEIDALIANCTTTWTTRNGVNGRLVAGKGDYADRSIFLPAAGYGYDSHLGNSGSNGLYWSSTPKSDTSNDAWRLGFDSGNFGRGKYWRGLGYSVRPVRGFAK